MINFVLSVDVNIYLMTVWVAIRGVRLDGFITSVDRNDTYWIY